MTLTLYVIAGVFVGSTIVSWVGGRMVERFQHPLAVGNAVVTRLCVGLALSIVAAKPAMRGGYAWIEFALLALLALWSFVMSVLLIWGLATGRLDDTEPAGGD